MAGEESKVNTNVYNSNHTGEEVDQAVEAGLHLAAANIDENKLEKLGNILAAENTNLGYYYASEAPVNTSSKIPGTDKDAQGGELYLQILETGQFSPSEKWIELTSQDILVGENISIPISTLSSELLICIGNILNKLDTATIELFTENDESIIKLPMGSAGELELRFGVNTDTNKVISLIGVTSDTGISAIKIYYR